MKELLKKLDACLPAIEWAGDKTWEEIYKTCHRGDWLLWLFKQTNPYDLQKITLAKGHCAATVLHLMKDERSINAVKVAIAFGEGNASREYLNNAAYAYAAAADAADTAAYYAAYAAADADAAYAAAADAKKQNQMETADICRKYLPIEIWNIGGNK